MAGTSRQTPAPAPEGRGRRFAAFAEDGFVSGVIGGAVVALFFLGVDLLQGRPFFTPTLLGSVLLFGKSVAEVDAASAPVVVSYTAVHMAAFIAVGMVAAYGVSEFERRPHVGVVLLLLFVCFEAWFLGFAFAFAPRVVPTLGGGLVALANALAAGAMAAYLLGLRHPRALSNLSHVWDDESP